MTSDVSVKRKNIVKPRKREDDIQHLIIRDALTYGVGDPRTALWVLPDGRLAGGCYDPYCMSREVDHTEFPHSEKLVNYLSRFREKLKNKDTRLYTLFSYIGNLVRYGFAGDSLYLSFYRKPTRQQVNTILKAIRQLRPENIFIDFYKYEDNNIKLVEDTELTYNEAPSKLTNLIKKIYNNEK